MKPRNTEKEVKKYVLIHQSEDGDPITVLSEAEVSDIKQLMEDYGIHKWREELEDMDTNYWDEGEGMLLEVEVKVPKPIKIVEKYEL